MKIVNEHEWMSFFLDSFLQKKMRMIDEDGWILEFRAENDTK